MKTCPVCGCDALEGAVIQERRRIRRAQSRALAHLKAHAQHIECASCVGDAVTIDRATRAPKRRSRNAR